MTQVIRALAQVMQGDATGAVLIRLSGIDPGLFSCQPGKIQRLLRMKAAMIKQPERLSSPGHVWALSVIVLVVAPADFPSSRVLRQPDIPASQHINFFKRDFLP